MVAWLTTLAAQLLVSDDDIAAMRALLLAASSGDGQAMLEACRMLGEAGDPVATLDAVADLPDALPQTVLAALVISSFASVRRDYRSRQDAAMARTVLGATAADAYGAIGSAFGYEALDWIVWLVGAAMIELSAIAATRAPLVRVETGISLPSTLLAFDLYGDPARAAEIVDRNRSGTAMLMPVTFEALAS